jgi:hypothetical protein
LTDQFQISGELGFFSAENPTRLSVFIFNFFWRQSFNKTGSAQKLKMSLNPRNSVIQIFAILGKYLSQTYQKSLKFGTF